MMIGDSSSCARCGTNTAEGRLYRFYFGVVIDDPEQVPIPGGAHGSPAPYFRATGWEEVYYCDRCLLTAATRGERIRIGFYCVLTQFAMLVVILLVVESGRGLWVAVVAFLVSATFAAEGFRQHWRLRTALREPCSSPLRLSALSSPMIQSMGDEWAIAHRRKELRGPGADMFLSRTDYEHLSQSWEPE